MKRESFKSSLGFLLVSAGCAIGIGNVWKFPYVAGEGGGGVFVLFYMLFLLIMGVPILTMEFSIGRASRLGAVGSYRALEPRGSRWHIHGYVAVIACYILMMYYTTIAGWMLDYFVKFLVGEFDTVTTTEGVDAVFSGMLSSPLEMFICMAVMCILGFLICSFSLQGGLERVTKYMMLGLFALIIVLVVYGLTLDGAAEGVAFYLIPNFERAMENGIFNVITSAMNQAFFTLSLGIACMEIFGSYMSGDRAITGEAIRICTLDTIVAISAGLIIFPACFAFGVSPDSGPSLIFKTLPNVFINMAGGRIIGSLFFLFMTFASFTTVIAVFQNLIASTEELFKLSKIKSVIINCAIILIGSIPAILGYNVWQGVTLIGGRDILDTLDFIVSNILIPLGSLVYLLFATTKWGWGFDNYIKECNTGRGMRMPRWLKPYFRFGLPIILIFIFISGLI